MNIPQSTEAEESVIGGILVYSRKFAEVAEIVEVQDFYQPALRSVFEAMLELDRAAKPIDAVTVAEQMRTLETIGRLTAFGGADYLPNLMAKVVAVENIAYHARIVRAKGERRRTIETLRELAAAGLGEDSDDEYRERVTRDLLAMLSKQSDSKGVPLKQVMKEACQAVEKRYDTRGTVTGISTGYQKLDGMLMGLQPGDLVLVAGRPSMGKSAWAFNVTLNAAFQGTAAMVFSLEMGRLSVGERMISADGPIEGMRLRSGRLERTDWVKLTNAATRLAALPVTIDDTGGLKIGDIRARARKWAAQNTGKRLVVVDYLQLIAGEQKRGGNREQEVASYSRGLKLLAKELEAPVVALCQLSRELERREDKRPMMSDLRESGSLEQDADVIAFVYRDEVYCDDCKNRRCNDPHRGKAEIIVAKQRNGPTGTVVLDWQPSYSRFVSEFETGVRQ